MGKIEICGVVGDKAYGNWTFIEQGGGKVASCVVVQDVKNPENYQFYAFHDKNKLDRMMIEIFKNIKCPYTGNHFVGNLQHWYILPDYWGNPSKFGVDPNELRVVDERYGVSKG